MEVGIKRKIASRVLNENIESKKDRWLKQAKVKIKFCTGRPSDLDKAHPALTEALDSPDLGVSRVPHAVCGETVHEEGDGRGQGYQATRHSCTQ